MEGAFSAFFIVYELGKLEARSSKP